MEKIKKTKQIKGGQETTAETDAIFCSVGDHIMGVVVVDKNGEIIRVNKGFEALTGWNEKEVLGKSLVKIMPREDEKRIRVPFNKGYCRARYLLLLMLLLVLVVLKDCLLFITSEKTKANFRQTAL